MIVACQVFAGRVFTIDFTGERMHADDPGNGQGDTDFLMTRR